MNLLRRARRALEISRRAPGWPALPTLFWWTFIRWVLREFFRFAYRIRVEGAEHVPPSGPIIYVANHQAHFDPCIVGVLVGDRPFSGMARATLFRNPVLGTIMRSIGVIALDQSKGDAGAFKAALAELQAGRCVLIFPEGTRTRDGAIGKFKPGVSLIIKRSGAPVLPVAIEGAYDIWPITTGKMSLKGRLAVRAAPLIAADELLADGAEAALMRLRSQLDAMRLDMRARMRRESGDRYPAPGPGDAPRRKQLNTEINEGTKESEASM